jgi:hypothetical protein
LTIASCARFDAGFGQNDREAAVRAAAGPVPAPHVSASAKTRCAAPVTVPEGINDVQAGQLWDRDRDALEDCGAKQAMLAKAVTIYEAAP